MKKLLIQPTIETYGKYLEFAKLNDMGFEIIDFALPQVLNLEYEHVIREYELKPETEKNLFISQHGVYLDLYINTERLNIGCTVFHSGNRKIIY
jgi:hypothetical protein